jgi:hydroxyacylglutathione hydrolase
MSLKLKLITVTPIQQNCRVIYTDSSKNCVVVDPGGDVELINSFLETNKLELSQIWLTHSHLDHCGGVKDLKSKFNVPLYASKIESVFRSKVEESCARFGIPPGYMENCPEPDFFWEEMQTIEFNEYKFDILFTPGHSEGHYCFYQKDCGVLLAGDTLFAGSIGRTDLPGGNHQQLIDSINNKILVLPDNTKVMSGHGPDTTVGVEKVSNPFLNGMY